MEGTLDPRAVAQSSRLIEESMIDLKVARLLAVDKSDGVRRRRLFFLQQSIEKSLKSRMNETNQLLLQLPKAIAAGHLYQGKDLREDPSFVIVTERFKSSVERYSSPKSLGHDPAAKLQLKATMQDFYLFAKAIGLGDAIASPILEAISHFGEKDVLKIMSRIDEMETRRAKIRAEAEEALKDPSGRGSAESMAKNFVIPGFVAAIIEINLNMMLLSRLTDFEQASRYPEEQIPSSLLDNLDQVDSFAALFIRFASEVGGPRPGIVWDKVKL